MKHSAAAQKERKTEHARLTKANADLVCALEYVERAALILAASSTNPIPARAIAKIANKAIANATGGSDVG